MLRLTELKLAQVMADRHAGLLTKQLLQRPFVQRVLLTKRRQVEGTRHRALQRRHQQIELFPLRQRPGAICRIAVTTQDQRQLQKERFRQLNREGIALTALALQLADDAARQRHAARGQPPAARRVDALRRQELRPVESQTEAIAAVKNIIQHQIVDAVVAVAILVADIEDVAAGNQPGAIVEDMQAVAAPDDDNFAELMPVRGKRGLRHTFSHRNRQAWGGKIVVPTQYQRHRLLLLHHLLALRSRGAAKFTPKQGGEMVAVAEAALKGDIGDAQIAMAQQVTRLQQTQAVQIALRRAAGLLLHLTVQRAQRQRKAVGQRFPQNFFTVVIVKPVEQAVQARLLILRLFIAARFTQQNQQLQKELLLSRLLLQRPAIILPHLCHYIQRLRHDFIIYPPVRGVAAILIVRQQRLQSREKAKRARAAVKHVGQAEILRLFIQMAIVIAHEADAAGAQRLRLSIENVNPRTLFHQHDFMKIVVMFGKRLLRHPGFDSDGVVALREEIGAV